MSGASSGSGAGGGATGSGGGGLVSASPSSAASSTSPSSSLSKRRTSAVKGKSELRLSVDSHLKAAPGGRSGVSVHDAPHSPIDLPDKEVSEQPADESDAAASALAAVAEAQPRDASNAKQPPVAAAKALPATASTASTPPSSKSSASPSALGSTPPSQPLLALQMMQGQAPPISSGFPSFAYANPQSAPPAPVTSPTHTPLQPPPGLAIAPPALSTAFIPATPSSSSALFLPSGMSTPSSVSSASSSSSSTSPSSPLPSDGRSIALRYLPTGRQRDALHALCASYGAITAIRLKRDQNTGQALGYGFVHYENREDAERAAEALDGRALGNKLIRVQIAKSPRGAAAGQQWSATAAASGARGAVVLSGVPRSWTSAQLQSLGSAYGQVTEVALLEDGKPATDPSSRSAVLRFTETPSAVACVAALNGTVPAGAHEPLSVRISSSPDRSGVVSNLFGSPASAPGSAQRSRRSSALSGPHSHSHDSHSTAGQPAFFASPFDPAAAHTTGHHGHVQQIPGGYAVYPATFTGDLLQALPSTVFPSAESYPQPQASASPSPGTGSPFASDAYYGHQTHLPYFTSPHSHALGLSGSGTSTPAASAPPAYMPSYHDASLYQTFPSPLMQQQMLAAQQQQQRVGLQPHLYQQHAAAAFERQQLLPQHMQADDMRKQHSLHAQQQQQQQLVQYAQHPLLLPHHPSLLLPHPPSHTHSSHLPPLGPYSSHLPPHGHTHPHLSTRGGGGPMERPGICLFVFHLPPELSDPELLALFSPLGAVLSCKIITNPHSGQSKGYGFVNYATMDGAKAAIAALNGFKLGSKFLKVQFKKKRED